MNEDKDMSSILFTSASVLDLLLQIEELKDYTIGMTETLDGKIQLQIDESIYEIDNNATILKVDDSIIQEIDTTIETTYDELIDDIEQDIDTYEEIDIDIIEGGIIKEVAKSLALGGLIRFARKHLL